MLAAQLPPPSSSQQGLSTSASNPEISPEEQEYIKRLEAATIPLFSQGRIIGNGIAISPNLILVAADCAQDDDLCIESPEAKKEEIERPVKMQAWPLFGEDSDSFKVLHVDTNLLKPIPLCILTKPESSIQISFNLRAGVPIIKRLDKSEVRYIRRINSPTHRLPLPPATQYDPQASGPIMSLNNGNVYAFLQRDSTSLSLFDFYQCLKEATYDNKDGKIDEREINAGIILQEVFTSQTSEISITIPISRDQPLGASNFEGLLSGDFIYTVLGGNLVDFWPKNNPGAHQIYMIEPLANKKVFPHLAKYLCREWLRIKRCPENLSAKVAGIQYEFTKIDFNQSQPIQQEAEQEAKNPN